MADISSKLTGMFGDFTGLGSKMGGYFMYFVGFLIFACLFGIILWFILSRKTYKNKIKVYGMIGGRTGIKWMDKGKLVPIGKAGDKLMYLKKSKRYLPPPTIQSGAYEWLYWEREDGELINIGIENLDETQKNLGIKFVDTDMRMQRLGIEKNLQFRLQKEGFWSKYGQLIIQVAFYVIVALMIIVLFIQWRKSGAVLTDMAGSVREMAGEVSALRTGQHPTTESNGSGLIPAFVLLITIKFKLWRMKNGRMGR